MNSGRSITTGSIDDMERSVSLWIILKIENIVPWWMAPSISAVWTRAAMRCELYLYLYECNYRQDYKNAKFTIYRWFDHWSDCQEREDLRSAVKRKTEADPHMKPRKLIIRRALQSTDGALDVLERRDANLIREAA